MSDLIANILLIGGILVVGSVIRTFYLSFLKKGKNYRADISVTRGSRRHISQVNTSVHFNYSRTRARYTLAAIAIVIVGFITIPVGIVVKSFLLGMMDEIPVMFVMMSALVFLFSYVAHLITGDQSRHKEIEELKHLSNRATWAIFIALGIHFIGISGSFNTNYPATLPTLAEAEKG